MFIRHRPLRRKPPLQRGMHSRQATGECPRLSRPISAVNPLADQPNRQPVVIAVQIWSPVFKVLGVIWRWNTPTARSEAGSFGIEERRGVGEGRGQVVCSQMR